jgi:DNA-directed RNA polymerase subunit omega
MPRVSSEKAVEAVGNRYNLVLIASIRARELKRGYRPKITTTEGNGPIITALAEVQAGLIGVEYLKRVKK